MTREPFCSTCPDHEACTTGALCDYVKAVAAEAVAWDLGDDPDGDADPWE